MVTRTLSHEEFLADLLDATPDGVLAFDREYRYTVWNAAMERISRVPRNEALGKHAFTLFPFFEEIGEEKYFREALAGRTVTAENRPYFVSETRRRGFFEARYSPLYHEGEIVGVVGVIREISQRKEIEEEKSLAHQGLTLLIENSPLAVIEWDSDFRVSRWSESAERLFGWKAEEVLGKHVSDWQFVVAEDLTAVEQVGRRQREGVELQGVLYNRNYNKDGSVLHCEWYNSVLTAESGELVSILSLVLDVTARKFAEEQLATLLSRERAARREAEEADRLKDEFLATLSHELRTPLTAVLGWASLMRSGDFPEGDFHRALEIIERNARSQARLIDDLLDVSRVIKGNLRLETARVNLAGVIEGARDVVRPATDAKGIRLTLDFDSRTPPVNGDPNRLRQVVWNLLLNAIKFTPRGGSVVVKLEPVELHARVTVSDTGEGISPDFLPYVFDRFRQAEASVARRQGGLGLGLAVVRHLVELHGGSVGVQSEGKGKGAVFTIDLPCVREHEELAAESPISKPPDRSSSRPGRVKLLDGLKVLVVEDDDDSRSLVGTLLRNHGADVFLAASVREAMKALEGIVPDVLVSDLGMPDEDGYAMIANLRRLPIERGGTAPAIALTGYATSKDREQALAAGYQVHMAKPIEPEVLVAAVAKLTRAEQLSQLEPPARET